MAGRALRVLFIEDSEDDQRIVLRELARGGFEVTAERVDSAVGLAGALARPWDVILCDYSMPGFGAMQAFAEVRGRGLDVPFLIVSGTIGEERAVEAMRAGVHDFVLKDRLARLVPAISRELAEAANRAGLRHAEGLLARTATLRSLGQMATGIAHDLKNLLNPLGLHLELLERAMRKGGVEKPDSAAAMRDIIHRATETIDRLRSFSRLEPERIAERLELAAAAREAAALVRPRLAETSGVVLVEELGAVGEVHARADEVIAAIVNVLVNAIEACGAVGTVALRTGGADTSAWIEIADDGPGMPAEVAERVFEPFFTTKGELGTGLGLANVFATMRRHGGDVLLDTGPGRGARFTLRFPR